MDQDKELSPTQTPHSNDTQLPVEDGPIKKVEVESVIPEELVQLLREAKQRLDKEGAPEYEYDGNFPFDKFSLQAGAFTKTDDEGTTVIGVSIYNPDKQIPEYRMNLAEDTRPTVKIALVRYSGKPPLRGEKEEDFVSEVVLNLKVRSLRLLDEKGVDDQQVPAIKLSATPGTVEPQGRIHTLVMLDHQLFDPEDSIEGVNLDISNEKVRQYLANIGTILADIPYSSEETTVHAQRYLDRRVSQTKAKGREASYHIVDKTPAIEPNEPLQLSDE